MGVNSQKNSTEQTTFFIIDSRGIKKKYLTGAPNCHDDIHSVKHIVCHYFYLIGTDYTKCKELIDDDLTVNKK